MKITILGARGSIPTEGEDMLEFGGATSCVLVEAGDQAIYLDAGTGIVKSPDIGDRPISILLTHPHIDHILGLPFFPYITKKDRQINFYGRNYGGLSSREQLDELLSPPLWPASADVYPAKFNFHTFKDPFRLGEVLIEGMDSLHPGGGTVYKVSHEGRSVVYATDYEYDEEKSVELIRFAKDTDLLLFDGQYTEEEMAKRKGFGHSTIAQGMKVMRESGAKCIRFVHHDPLHSDSFLRDMEEGARSIYRETSGAQTGSAEKTGGDNTEAKVAIARKGEVIIL